ncbi:MAG TPA: glycoside hydrolase family 97 protein [Chitinophagales bacterium]|nr:glycoside hydrolase family 97 protein [Chitinophagales bacterium]HMZ88650.1 glycoside hydrolase family 97 protein [Chitinophagales bacterium]HNE46388.1 glycoside hydrolase family 97 protein [Chitinophagales bacterium]HNF69631.1 glycoside hydrolase family 97 protein [Chitinophagales bacterium]HNK97142.1 glycoside hydrolase family 97 protein [Chitinophagales bacterium]
MKSILTLLCGVLLSTSLPAVTVTSPDRTLLLNVDLDKSGALHYSLSRNGAVVIAPSLMGFSLKDLGELTADFEAVDTVYNSIDTYWEPVWGEVAKIHDNHNEMTFTVRHKKTGIVMEVIFRMFNDGMGFRYQFPVQSYMKYFTVLNEKTQFCLNGDHQAWWIPGDYDTNEYFYTESKLSDVHAITASTRNREIATRSPIGDNYVQSPLMMKSSDGLYINIFEAALVNYPAMHLEVDREKHILTSRLATDAVGNCAYLSTPCHTPWRTVIVSDKATDILGSHIILNLNEPCAIANTDWIKPMKFVGIWWEMHVGTASWNYSDVNNINLETTDWTKLPPNGHHGATTERTKYYIDFAAANGFDGVLVEGWNVGWEDWFGNWKENVFDFVTPYPDYNVQELSAYAKSKGVSLIMHHETSASVTNYERRLQQAMQFMVSNGYPAVKTGYVGRIIPRGEYHDGQWMVNHYVYVAQEMAKHHLMVDAHEPVRPTGLQRTYPNWLACEAARGNEFNAWSQGNPPEHETILPFTRLMGGPMDYTPGIFEVQMSTYGQQTGNQVHTTLAKQLALYVTMYSPLQMAADIPENYLKYADAFQFIKDVAVDWQDTKYLEAEPGDYLTVARKEKGGRNWFVGAITDDKARRTSIKLDFLDDKQVYIATIYGDAEGADWKTNPKAYMITQQKVTNMSTIKLELAPGGGAAVSIMPIQEN